MSVENIANYKLTFQFINKWVQIICIGNRGTVIAL